MCTRKHVTYDTNGGLIDCLFCRISNGREAANPLWYSDEEVAVFVPNKTLAGRLHFLIVPRAHVHQLGPSMVTRANASSLPATLDHMQQVAVSVLDRALSAGIHHEPLAAPPVGWSVDIAPAQQLPIGCQLAFHRPPFNSVDHLHLHAVCTPFRNLFQRAKFLSGI
jgi:diadenosine tetraphosphate (Ap4A) HIT family hydrolase